MNKDKLYIGHILDCIEKIEEMSAAGKNAFIEDYKVRDVILRNLQIMAESTQRLSSNFKNDVPEINWQELSDFRNVMVHEYMGLDMNLVWLSLKNDLPDLKKAVVQNTEK